MNSTALLYVLGVVICWGLYSVFLHMGSIGMKITDSDDLTSNRMKAFLLVGIAYFLVAVVGPLIVLKIRESGAASHWKFPAFGWQMSLVAGLLGAFGAFFLLMALGSDGGDVSMRKVLIAMVPTLVFAGAPLVNAVVSVTKEHLWSKTPPQFFAGLLLAAIGAGLVMYYKPSAGPAKKTSSLSAPATPGFTKTGLPVPKPEPVLLSRQEREVAPGYADVTKRNYFVS
ncbi:MAG TPA: hypothetical protein VG796_20725 [Verrucomicrobiales bacterium]|nr:hypothetical protein [Verrucomicrobiales bacterium]